MQNKLLKYSTVLFLLVLFLGSYAQSDTVLIQSKIDEARSLFSENPKKSLTIAFQANDLANKGDHKRLTAFSLNTIGSAYNYIGNNDSSIFYHQQALVI